MTFRTKQRLFFNFFLNFEYFRVHLLQSPLIYQYAFSKPARIHCLFIFIFFYFYFLFFFIFFAFNVFFFFFFITFCFCLYFNFFRELQRIENATNSPVISHLSETIQGVTTIRAYNQESRFTEILFRRLEENTIAFTILNTSNRWLGISLVSKNTKTWKGRE